MAPVKCIQAQCSLGYSPFSGCGSVVVDLLFSVPPVVCRGTVFVFVLLCITLCPLYFCNHLEEEERVDCFAFIVFCSLVTVNFLWLFLTVLWVGLQCVIVVFPDHAHLLRFFVFRGLLSMFFDFR